LLYEECVDKQSDSYDLHMQLYPSLKHIKLKLSLFPSRREIPAPTRILLITIAIFHCPNTAASQREKCHCWRFFARNLIKCGHTRSANKTINVLIGIQCVFRKKTRIQSKEFGRSGDSKEFLLPLAVYLLILTFTTSINCHYENYWHFRNCTNEHN
jgi:hypothetical protein